MSCPLEKKCRLSLGNRRNLENVLVRTDVHELLRVLLGNGIISSDQKDKFMYLDEDRLCPEERIRYLLQHVRNRIKENGKMFSRVGNVLCSLGGEEKDVCEFMGKDMEGGSNLKMEIRKRTLLEKDVLDLVHILVPGSNLWNEIGIALHLPKFKRDDCGRGGSNVDRLTNILTAWVLDNSGDVKAATLSNLEEALSSKIVNLGRLALSLKEWKGPTQAFDFEKKFSLVSMPEVVDQTYFREVLEGRSTLLEVQVTCTECETYQWSKDGQPLLEGTDFSGVCSNILYINKAHKSVEGKYSCHVVSGSESVCSDEIDVVVIYPPEKEHLVTLYSIRESEAPKDSWPPVGKTTFINLVLIKQSPISKENYFTICGDMDDILEDKERVGYSDVFREYRDGAVVLVEGRPGSGKTTLVHEVTRDWATGKDILQGARMVFLLTLRMLQFYGSDNNLFSILKTFYSDEEQCRNIETDLNKKEGKGACFILDGLDEYRTGDGGGKSLVYQLIYKKCLPCSMIIVASRPVATLEIKKKGLFKRVEVIGFTKEQIFQYVETYYSNRCDVSEATCSSNKLKKYLRDHVNVLHMCYLPVHAAMICFLHSELEGNIPQTETQIYEQFTISTLLRQKKQNKDLRKLESLRDLPEEVNVQFRVICELAFNMIMNSQQVVHHEDIQQCLSDSTSSVLGLLTVEHTYKYYGEEYLYTFHHLSFQEYLAAVHIAGVELQEQKRIICGCGGRIKLSNVKKYYCGMIQTIGGECLLHDVNFIERLMNDGLKFPGIGLVNSIQRAFESQSVMLCDYVIECLKVKYLSSYITSSDFAALGYVISAASHHLSSLVFESCTWDYDGAVAFSSIINTSKLQFVKCLRIEEHKSNDDFKEVNALLCQLPYIEELHLIWRRYLDILKNRRTINNHVIKSITTNLALPELKVLHISLSGVNCSNPEVFLKMLTFGIYKSKHVFFSDLQYESSYDSITPCMKYLRHALSCLHEDVSLICLFSCDLFPNYQERLTRCTEVVLVNCGLDDEGAEVLTKKLNGHVQTLVLDFNRISDLGAVALAGCLARCSEVQEVSIQCNFIGDSGAAALADALVHCSHLRRLDLQGNCLSDEGVTAVANLADSLPVVKLYIYNVNVTRECIEKILQHRSDIKVRTMEFSSSWEAICDEGIDSLRRAFKCGNIPALKVSSTNIDNIRILVNELEDSKNIKGLECHDIDDVDLLTLGSILNNNLQNFKLQRSHSLTQNVVDNLIRCKNLCNVSFEVESTSDVAVFSFLDAVKKNLQSLQLSGCDIDSISLLGSHPEFCVSGLVLSNCTSSSGGLSRIFFNPVSWSHLQYLSVTKWVFSSYDVHALSKVLVHCKRLCGLTLSDYKDTYCILDTNRALVLAEGIKNCTSLLELDLSLNLMTSNCLSAILQVIKCDDLQSLRLYDYNIVDRNMPFLANFIGGTSLRKLVLVRNTISCNGAGILSAGLKRCKHLIELNVCYNHIGSSGVILLASGLKDCLNLQTLGLSYNNIASDAVPALVEVMNACKHLQLLNLNNNNKIDIDGAISLVRGWKHKNLLKLYLDFSEPHKTNLIDIIRCCSSCDHLLEAYYDNEYILIYDEGLKSLPKRIF